ncbi:MAG: HepT-like ribonuclease domain-containing protein [Desulfobulbaceae bacterium]|nr:HepT-like ribonuclease domain-containing protein [Desulfobulbaceae bacterium]
MPNQYLKYLSHILEETRHLAALAGQMDKDTFMADETAKRAVAASIEIIGESALRIPRNVRDSYPRIEWRDIAGLRWKLYRDSPDADYDLAWEYAVNRASLLHVQIEEVLAEEKGR